MNPTFCSGINTVINNTILIVLQKGELRQTAFYQCFYSPKKYKANDTLALINASILLQKTELTCTGLD